MTLSRLPNSGKPGKRRGRTMWYVAFAADLVFTAVAITGLNDFWVLDERPGAQRASLFALLGLLAYVAVRAFVKNKRESFAIELVVAGVALTVALVPMLESFGVTDEGAGAGCLSSRGERSATVATQSAMVYADPSARGAPLALVRIGCVLRFDYVCLGQRSRAATSGLSAFDARWIALTDLLNKTELGENDEIYYVHAGDVVGLLRQLGTSRLGGCPIKDSGASFEPRLGHLSARIDEQQDLVRLGSRSVDVAFVGYAEWIGADGGWKRIGASDGGPIVISARGLKAGDTVVRCSVSPVRPKGFLGVCQSPQRFNLAMSANVLCP